MRNLPKFDDPNLIVGAEWFSDAGVYRLAENLMIVQSVDFFPPLVDDPFLFGQIAAANSLSDIYAMGADPKTALNIVGFPDDKLDLDILGEILRGGADRVSEAGAVIIGGHTVRDVEIKYGLSATGIVTDERLLTNRQASPGDALVLTKAIGTGFITTAFKAGRCAEAVLAAATASMAQLNKIGRDAALAHCAHATTDITGFGLGGHAGEMAQASGVTLHLEVRKLPILPGAAELAQSGNHTRASSSNRSYAESITRVEGTPDATGIKMVFDPQTSGGLLISVPEKSAEKVVAQARDAGAEASCVIGFVTEQEGETAIVVQA